MIAVITYDKAHRKTQEIILRLIAKGHKNIEVMAIPFIEKKVYKSLLKHRPSELIVEIENDVFFKNLNIRYQKILIEDLNIYFQTHKFDSILLAGAGILPKELVENHKIINSHPGILPNVRGLDALKWAIYNKQDIGVTVHYIDEEADAGYLITQKNIIVKRNDSFYTIARKLWELEMNLMVESLDIITKIDFKTKVIDTKNTIVNRRMPKEKELELETKIKEYIDIFAT